MKPISKRRSSRRVMFFGRLIDATGGGTFRGCGFEAAAACSAMTMWLGLGGAP